MTRPQDASTTEQVDVSVDPEVMPDSEADAPEDYRAEDLANDEDDTIILSRRAFTEPFDLDDEDDDDEDASRVDDADEDDAEPSPHQGEEAAPQPPTASAATVGGSASPATGSLSRYAPSGTIPIIGDANPITGSMPVIGPIYPPKPRRPWIIATCVLAALLIGAGYLGWRMWEINGEWQQYADEVEEANYALGEQIASVQQELTDKQNEADLLSEQLATNKARVVDLSAEKAAAIDSSEYASQVTDKLEETLSLGQVATSSLTSCIDGLEQLVSYLQAPEDEYEADEISNYADSVTDLCDTAEGATSTFQDSLTE
ncbi:hypothetical protein [Demequina sp. NBRC 110057]|uniref:hypothetical protein n=1 Tax=Demequina sp. NBRC 110057 TaxID=1570346 RepID=UPI0009FD5BE4|nr:hypothetical protein [Demequina sp. NBRC 110057]